MKRMLSPKPNRKGEYEVHSVPSRMAARMAGQGWTEVPDGIEDCPQGSPQGSPESNPLTESLSRRKRFVLSGAWFSVRHQVRRELDMDRMPESKDEARYLLEDAGYEVVD